MNTDERNNFNKESQDPMYKDEFLYIFGIEIGWARAIMLIPLYIIIGGIVLYFYG